MDCNLQNSSFISIFHENTTTSLFQVDILPQHAGEQIVTSKENTTWNFINKNKSSKNVSKVNGNGG